jgi:alkanesulfonate monooxygenase SsuD/methylene tetrahydromethanopterin reductase-like flavin-dependent oxidoreductase (luciferase family)
MTADTPFKFGIFDHLDDAGIGFARQYRERLAFVEACDNADFHAYHIAEHHGTPHGIAPSPNLFLSAVAQRTRRIRLGPLVMLLNLYHPLRAFEEICMLDQISGGRLELGLGLGATPIELGFYGVDPEEARARYTEATDLIYKAIATTAGETLTHQGRYFDVRDFPVLFSTLQRPRPPIWIGTMHHEAGQWAADQAAHVACVGPTEKVRAVTDAFRARWASRANRDAVMPFLGMVRQVVIADTDAEARALAEPAYLRWYDTFTYLFRVRGLAMPPSPAPTFEQSVASGFSVVGTVSSVRDALARQASEAGINYLLCQIAFGSLPLVASLRTVSAMRAEIMPHFVGTPAPVRVFDRSAW